MQLEQFTFAMVCRRWLFALPLNFCTYGAGYDTLNPMPRWIDLNSIRFQGSVNLLTGTKIGSVVG